MTTIAVAGATGNLGGRIVDALLARGAGVRAFVRAGVAREKLARLERPGVAIVALDYARRDEVARACAGVACVVSALQGLRDVIVDAQTVLLDAAIAAGVPRFVPSDYSIDFMKQPAGTNRNLDLRREFHARLDAAAIRATSVLNGAFAELLTSRMPLLDFDAKCVRYWGSADQKLDFTTVGDTATFTAAAALDATTPTVLRIAGDSLSARELAVVAGDVVGAPFESVRLGSVDELAARIAQDRAADPAGETQPYPRWQGAQYLLNMFSGLAKLEPLDNARYADLRWTRARDVLAAR